MHACAGGRKGFRPGRRDAWSWTPARSSQRRLKTRSPQVLGSAGNGKGPAAAALDFYSNQRRIRSEGPIISAVSNLFRNFPVPGYTLSDVNATQRFSARIDGVVQITNVMNSYRQDGDMLSNAAMGRQTKFGVRLRF